MSIEFLLVIILAVIVLAVVHHYGIKAIREAVFAYVGTELAALRAEFAALREAIRAKESVKAQTAAQSSPPPPPVEPTPPSP